MQWDGGWSLHVDTFGSETFGSVPASMLHPIAITSINSISWSLCWSYMRPTGSPYWSPSTPTPTPTPPFLLHHTHTHLAYAPTYGAMSMLVVVIASLYVRLYGNMYTKHVVGCIWSSVCPPYVMKQTSICGGVC